MVTGSNAGSSTPHSYDIEIPTSGYQEKKPKMKQRYNPYKDPNFDPDAPEFTNYEKLDDDDGQLILVPKCKLQQTIQSNKSQIGGGKVFR